MKAYYSIILFVCTLTSCSDNDKNNADTYSLLKTFGETWSTHDIDAMTSLFTEDCVYEEITRGLVFEGREGVATYAMETFTAIPDFHIEITTINSSDSWAVMEWIMKGSAPMQESVEATTFQTKGVSAIELRDGKIYRIRDYWCPN